MTPKRPRDPNQLAKSIIDIATGEKPHDPAPGHPDGFEHARRGGLKGGQVRADKLSPEERSAIAKKGAAARWKKS
jgi:hypothetical protein